MKHHKLPCGCVADSARWHNLCPSHRNEWQTIHSQAASDYQARALILQQALSAALAKAGAL